MMDDEQLELVRLVSAYVKGTLDETEAAALEAWALRDPFVGGLIQEYQDSRLTDSRLATLNAIPLSADWERILAKRRDRRRRKGFRIWGGIAAAVLCFVGATWLMYPSGSTDNIIEDTRYGHKNDVLPGSNKAVLTLSSGKEVMLGDQGLGRLDDASSVMDLQSGKLLYAHSDTPSSGNAKHQVAVPIGGTYHLVLADGTKVWVNADSRLVFPPGFPAHERRVHVEGEAYFEIARDSERPFIVEVGSLQVTALGTAFNVNTHVGAGKVKAILTEGKIKVNQGTHEKVIEPGFAVVSQADGLRVEAADTEEALAWKEGYFYFNYKDMETILKEVTRWYGVEVSSTVVWGKKRYIGSIKRSATLGGVCALLADLSGKHFSIVDKKLIVN